MKKFVFLLFLPFLKCYPIENCLLYKENGECHECALGYIAAENKKQCNPCIDMGCEMCSSNLFHSCKKCKEGYFYYDKQCGVGCALVENCNICSADLSECLKCNKGCSVIDGECSCTLRRVLIAYSVIIIVLIVIIVTIYWRRRKAMKKIAEIEEKNKKNRINNVVNENPENDKDKNNTQRPKISMHINSDSNREQKIQTNTSLLDEVDEKVDTIKIEHKLPTVDDKTNTMSSMGKKLCDYCLIEPGVAKLQCGCYLCQRHRNYNEFTNTPNTCPVCKAKLV